MSSGTTIDRASCQSCGEITIYTGDSRCAYCDGRICRIDISHKKSTRSDNNRSRWTDLRRQQVIDAYAQGHGIPEIAAAICEAMGYKNLATARGAIRHEFKRMGVGLRAPRGCETEGCTRTAITSSKFCFSHSPEHAQRRLEIGVIMRSAQSMWPRKGEDHHLAKLWPEEVAAIRASDEPADTLAGRYGISADHVRSVRSGRSWSHLEAAA